MVLRLYPLRFEFVAVEPIRFPAGKSANLLRGAFGHLLRDVACVAECPGARVCERRDSCAYARIFEPRGPVPGENSPSGLVDWPRPFVFRALHLEGRTVLAGEAFHFDLNLFEPTPEAVGYLSVAFSRLASEGLGPGRGKARLVSVVRADTGEPGGPLRDFDRALPSGRGSQSQPSAVSVASRDRDGAPSGPTGSALALDLTPVSAGVRRITVCFLTPTELKSGGRVLDRPDFAALAARARDRVSTLCELYGPGPLPLDFRGFSERAALIQMTRREVRHVEVQRTSSRTRQTHSLGGFVGEADYEGDLDEFLPFLRAAHWTGVGRQTVWGKGQIEVTT